MSIDFIAANNFIEHSYHIKAVPNDKFDLLFLVNIRSAKPVHIYNINHLASIFIELYELTSALHQLGSKHFIKQATTEQYREVVTKVMQVIAKFFKGDDFRQFIDLNLAEKLIRGIDKVGKRFYFDFSLQDKKNLEKFRDSLIEIEIDLVNKTGFDLSLIKNCALDAARSELNHYLEEKGVAQYSSPVSHSSKSSPKEALFFVGNLEAEQVL